MRNAAFKSFRRFVLRGGLTLRDDAILLDVALALSGSLVKRRVIQGGGDEEKGIREKIFKREKAFYRIRFFLSVSMFLFIIIIPSRMNAKFYPSETRYNGLNFEWKIKEIDRDN